MSKCSFLGELCQTISLTIHYLYSLHYKTLQTADSLAKRKQKCKASTALEVKLAYNVNAILFSNVKNSCF